MLLEAHIEEFEQGTWVADLILDKPFGDTPTVPAQGTFQLPDGSTWIGTKLSETHDRGRYFAKVVGGNGCLGKTVLDQAYNGAVTLLAAASAICAAGPSPLDLGETPGVIPQNIVFQQYQRLLGTRSEALDALATFAGGVVTPGGSPLLWWIGRDATLQMQVPDPVYGSRSPQPFVTGTRNMDGVDVDASAELVTPTGAVLGALYGTPTQAVRHIRWKYQGNTFSARVFFVPFIFRPPTQTKYDRQYDAGIISDNGDGTVDVLAYRSPSEGSTPAFAVSKVPLFCGVPGSKVKMMPGEIVTLGFFGGDPQKPFCMSMKQDATVAPTKQVARNGDSVQVPLRVGIVGVPGSLASLAAVLAPAITSAAPGSPCVPTPGYTSPAEYDLDGTITSGSARLLVGDA